MKTLLIDDDPFVLKMLARQLERLGCESVASCESAKSAQALLESEFETIGLVFCDLQMPDIDGVEFVRHLARIGYRGGLVLPMDMLHWATCMLAFNAVPPDPAVVDRAWAERRR